MFNSQAILIALAVLLGSMGLGFYNGQEWANTKHEAQRAKDQDAYAMQLKQQMARAEVLSDKLAKAESRVITKTIEVIKHVKSVTTGRDCLGPAAVSLLQPGNSQGLRQPTGEPDAESPGASATDTDIGYWIAEANQQYDTCAARQHALIDWAAQKEGGQ